MIGLSARDSRSVTRTGARDTKPGRGIPPRDSRAAALLGGLEGAVAGAAASGVLGRLVSPGISKEHILKYEQRVKAGKYLLVAHGSPEEVKKAQQILAGTKPADLTVHGPAAA